MKPAEMSLKQWRDNGLELVSDERATLAAARRRADVKARNARAARKRARQARRTNRKK